MLKSKAVDTVYNITLSIDNLVRVLHENGQALKNKGDTIGEFRNIQRWLWEWKDSTEYDSHVRFLVFFLKSFIERVFYNFTLDIVFAEGQAEQIYLSFCETVGDEIAKLGTHLQKKNYNEFYLCYVKMGTAYLDAVNKFNE